VVSSGDLPINIAWTKDGVDIPHQLGVVVQVRATEMIAAPYRPIVVFLLQHDFADYQPETHRLSYYYYYYYFLIL